MDLEEDDFDGLCQMMYVGEGSLLAFFAILCLSF